jgi:hypothetical protein
MQGTYSRQALATTLAVLVVAAWCVGGNPNPGSTRDRRDRWTTAFNDGNFKDAYDGLRKLVLDPDDDRAEVGKDLTLAIRCLQKLGRSEEIDDFRERAIGVHRKNWRVLDAAARSVLNSPHAARRGRDFHSQEETSSPPALVASTGSRGAEL